MTPTMAQGELTGNVTVHSGCTSTDHGVTTLHQFLPQTTTEMEEWHPNRILAAVVQFVESRIEDSGTLKRTRRLREKTFDPIRTMRTLARSSDSSGKRFTGTWRQRQNGKHFFMKVMSLTCQSSVRQQTPRSTAQWNKLSKVDMFLWELARMVATSSEVAPHVAELSDKRPTGRRQVPSVESIEKKGATKKQDTLQVEQHPGYGYVLTYNTKLGQDNEEVVKIIHTGATGEILRSKLKVLKVYQDAFEELWIFVNNLAEKYSFATVNVALEHSEHGDHKARVHFHVFIGIDLSGGPGFAQFPHVRNISLRELEWGDLRPHVSPTMTTRKTWTAIYQAVATGAYYVAGPKTSVIMKRSTHRPIEDR